MNGKQIKDLSIFEPTQATGIGLKVAKAAKQFKGFDKPILEVHCALKNFTDNLISHTTKINEVLDNEKYD